MSEYMNTKWSWIDGSHGMRRQLFNVVTDEDLVFSPGGMAVTLGELFREMGEVQHAYNQSLLTFKTDFSYRTTDTELSVSVQKIAAWYIQLEAEMKSVLTGFSDADYRKNIERGGGYAITVDLQMDIYLQALLIFFGKVSVYLRILNKEVSAYFAEYIG
ncbi:MAG TPA: hypothetical protein VMW73_14735 [Spirochaetia bacterium]|nr:hypothetical protein [Spirochaetia bacterium]